jgi:general secretion pathway protein H
VTALATPSFSGLAALVTLNAGARELASALRSARSRAIAQHREVVLVIESQRMAPGLEIHMLPAPMRSAAAHGEVRFFPDGSSSGARIRLAAKQRQCVVEVDWLTGRVAIHD